MTVLWYGLNHHFWFNNPLQHLRRPFLKEIQALEKSCMSWTYILQFLSTKDLVPLIFVRYIYLPIFCRVDLKCRQLKGAEPGPGASSTLSLSLLSKQCLEYSFASFYSPPSVFWEVGRIFGCSFADKTSLRSFPVSLSDTSTAEHFSVFDCKHRNLKVNEKTLTGIIKYTFRWVFKNLRNLVKTNIFAKCFLTDSRTQQFHLLHLCPTAASARSARLLGSSDLQNSKLDALMDQKIWNMTLSIKKTPVVYLSNTYGN